MTSTKEWTFTKWWEGEFPPAAARAATYRLWGRAENIPEVPEKGPVPAAVRTLYGDWYMAYRRAVADKPITVDRLKVALNPVAEANVEVLVEAPPGRPPFDLPDSSAIRVCSWFPKVRACQALVLTGTVGYNTLMSEIDDELTRLVAADDPATALKVAGLLCLKTWARKKVG